MASMQIITGRERRRSWSEGQKRAIVAAAFAPGAIVADVVRRAEVCAGQIYRWRQELGRTERGFSEVVIAAVDDRSRDRGALGPAPAIEIGVCRQGSIAHCGIDATRIGGGGGQGSGPMIPVPTGVRVWIATGHTDMRRGMNGLALQIQQGLKRDPHAGDLFVFRGRRGDLIKILWHDGLGMSLYAKRLERGRFIWPSPADGVVAIAPAQLAYMLEGIDWRNPQHTWRPHAVG
jgi:transposase